MVKIQVLDKGYHPLVGFLPKLTPFYADQNTIGWLIATGIRKIRYYNADTNKMEDINRNNYITICNHIFTNPTPAVIQKEFMKTWVVRLRQSNLLLLIQDNRILLGL